MKRFSSGSRALAALLLAPASATFASPSTPAGPLVVGSTGITTVAPRVPVAAGSPCVVDLFHNEVVTEYPAGFPDAGNAYTYSPPAGCHGPWAKVVLKVTVNEETGGFFADASKAYIRLAGVPIFVGSLSNLPTQMNPMPPNGSFQAERDVTDLASLLTHAHHGSVGLLPEQVIWTDNLTNEQASVSARLLFYRASAATPAQKAPDAAYRVRPDANTVTLPHNIVRAYLDIYNAEPWWFTCLPDHELTIHALFSPLALGGQNRRGIFPPTQGCAGGSFAEILVRIDGTPAGVAPVFPLLSSNTNYYFHSTFNAPAQPPQMLDYMPYRVDLTPFAAILNEAGSHTISLSRPDDAYLLVYQDKGRAHVSGAVTINTLAGSPGTPTVTDTTATSGDTATGAITTDLDRDFRIHGYVNTSHGRVDANVRQTNHFDNLQLVYVDGLVGPDYRQYQQRLWLASQTWQHSRLTRAGVVLNDEVRKASYPLHLEYYMLGEVVDFGDGPETQPTQAGATVEQHRNLDASYQKAGFGLYSSRVRDSFNASRSWRPDVDFDWYGQAQYRFNDNQGSCYESALTTFNGAVASEAHGAGCGGHNHVRWYAHPDGSADSLGWAH